MKIKYFVSKRVWKGTGTTCIYAKWHKDCCRLVNKKIVAGILLNINRKEYKLDQMSFMCTSKTISIQI